MLKQIKIDGVRIAYQETGEGRALILLHGVGAAQELWDKIREPLSRHFRVITPDLPGCGRSAKPLRFDYSFLRQAEVMQKFILSFADEKIILGGNSLGGGIALAVAPQIQEKLSHLILMGSICYPQAIPWGFAIARRPVVGELAMLLVPAKWLVRLILKEALYDDTLATPEWVRALARPARSLFWRWAQLRTIRKIIPPDVPSVIQTYKRIKIPTLVIWGKDDLITPVNLTDQLLRALPHARREILPFCGHLPQFEKPDLVGQLILDFLKK